jgi:hypothetical protein
MKQMSLLTVGAWAAPFTCTQDQTTSLELLPYTSTKESSNGDLLLLACTFLFTFPSASKFLREQNIVKLPHPFYLKTFNLHNVNGEINESLKYNLTQKANTTENHEKKVCLLLDEIYVKPKITYTGNNVIGVASNSDTFQAASTLQFFMIRIICGCSVTCKKYDFKIFV